MKKLLSLKTLLICISFTVFLLLVKDNMNVLWSALVHKKKYYVCFHNFAIR